MKFKQGFDVLHAHEGLSKVIALAGALVALAFIKSRILALRTQKAKRKRR